MNEEGIIVLLQERLWQLQVQWQWLQQRQMQPNNKSVNTPSVEAPDIRPGESCCFDGETRKMTGNPKDKTVSEKCAMQNATQQDVEEADNARSALNSANLFIRSTLMEFMSIFSEVVAYTAQVTSEEFRALQELASDLSNSREHARYLHRQDSEIINGRNPRGKSKSEFQQQWELQENSEQFPGQDERFDDYNYHRKTGCINKPTARDCRRTEAITARYALAESNSKVVKDNHNRKNIRNKTIKCNRSARDALGFDERRKCVATDDEVKNMRLHPKCTSQLLSNTATDVSRPLEEKMVKFLEQKEKNFQKPCNPSPTNKRGHHGRKIKEGDERREHFEMLNIDGIYFELVRWSQAIVSLHQEVLGAVHVLHRVPPRRWMFWVDDVLHLVSQCMEGTSIFLTHCWTMQDYLPQLSPSQLEQILQMTNHCWHSQSQHLKQRFRESPCKPTHFASSDLENTFGGSRNKQCNGNDHNAPKRKNNQCVGAYNDGGLIEPVKRTDHVHSGIKDQKGTETLSGIQNNLQEAVLNRDMGEHKIQKANIRKELANRAQKANKVGQQPSQSKPSPQDFNAKRFRIVHHMGIVNTSAINLIHRMGEELAVALSFQNTTNAPELILPQQQEPCFICHGRKQDQVYDGSSEEQNTRRCDELQSQWKQSECSTGSLWKTQRIHSDDQVELRDSRVEDNMDGLCNNSEKHSMSRKYQHAVCHQGQIRGRCGQDLKARTRQYHNRHHPYFPKGCFLMTEDACNASSSFLCDSRQVESTQHARYEAKNARVITIQLRHTHHNGLHECRDSFSETPQTSARSSLSNTESGQQSEMDSLLSANQSICLPFQSSEHISSSSKFCRNAAKECTVRMTENVPCMTRCIKSPDREISCRYWTSPQEWLRPSFGSSTDDSTVDKHCLQRRYLSERSHDVEVETPPMYSWRADSSTDEILSPFCDMLYPPKNWQTLTEGRDLVEDWQRLRQQLTSESSLPVFNQNNDLRKELTRKALGNFLQENETCLSLVMQEIELHQTLWQAKQYFGDSSRQKQENNAGTQLLEQLYSVSDINEVLNSSTAVHEHTIISGSPHETRQFRHQTNGTPSKEHNYFNQDENKNEGIRQGVSIDNGMEAGGMFRVRKTILAPEPVKGPASLPSPVSTYDSTYSNNFDSMSCQDTSVEANYCGHSCQAPCKTLAHSTPASERFSLRCASLEANYGTLTPHSNKTTTLPSREATQTTIVGSNEKHALAIADALLASHRKAFRQMLFLRRSQGIEFPHKLVNEMCDGLEAALEQSKLMVKARPTVFVRATNERDPKAQAASAADHHQTKDKLSGQENFAKIFDMNTQRLNDLKLADMDNGEILDQPRTTKPCSTSVKDACEADEESKTLIGKFDEEYQQSMRTLEDAIVDIFSIISEQAGAESTSANNAITNTVTTPNGNHNCNQNKNKMLETGELASVGYEKNCGAIEEHNFQTKEQKTGNNVDTMKDKLDCEHHITDTIGSRTVSREQETTHRDAKRDASTTVKPTREASGCSQIHGRPLTNPTMVSENYRNISTTEHGELSEMLDGKKYAMRLEKDGELWLQQEGAYHWLSHQHASTLAAAHLLAVALLA
ncbi:uncharacterized protein LOC108679636 isoform X2 [Hyalella azteca]|uniref:Uncharacterized protein LOC108679636 isoform X2 n=1 Tax=Hyalella azteca TaxID=294128 RepID=A0A8B7PCG0_HYAAZ|nr:uncharacterized protein LOC108679636 isoform X2 [Hyalella azteca]